MERTRHQGLQGVRDHNKASLAISKTETRFKIPTPGARSPISTAVAAECGGGRKQQMI
jgi:hypothetical protein